MPNVDLSNIHNQAVRKDPFYSLEEYKSGSNSLPQILIVDDNTFFVYSLQLLVEQHFKMPTETAYSGQEGIARVRARLDNGLEPHKLILTDINMPEMDGFQMSVQILKMIRDRQRK